MDCLLCQNHTNDSNLITGPLERNYYHCPNCDLVFMNPGQRFNTDLERGEYESHENSPQSEGYVAFLNQAIEPALPFLIPGSNGLDYGSGPGPTLAILLREKGYACENYDPLFGPPLKDKTYDFIFSTETFEHFYDPEKEMEQLGRLLLPGGILTIMTLLKREKIDFSNWYYARDPTHVIFFSQTTFRYIARRWNYRVLYDDGCRVVVLQKL